MKILRPGIAKKAKYVIDTIKIENGKMIWKDKKTNKDEWKNGTE